jgi:hypothetical protein
LFNWRVAVCLLFAGTIPLSGCTSISKGVMQAFMDKGDEGSVDKRQCWVSGRSFAGIDSLFDATQVAQTSAKNTLKILKVHGIGAHAPGYSQRLLDGLVKEIGFKNKNETVKTLYLRNSRYPDNLGVLTVHRYFDTAQSRVMIFYELTWDSIVEEEKQLISYDNNAQSSAKRTGFNNTMKGFVNNTVPDVLMYNGGYREQIQSSVGQAICWMMSADWAALSHNQRKQCDILGSEFWSQSDNGNMAIISHSLGSRIALDGLQRAGQLLAEDPKYQVTAEKLKHTSINLYMLSNQLPLLQLGQAKPKIVDQVDAICRPGSDKYDQRFFAKLQLVAFSDPNDLFSYSVGPNYINRYVDSRLCPVISNVVIQVAPVTEVLGLQEIANPLKAHTGYETDSRVLKMLVNGLGGEHGHSEVKSRCEFIESIPNP